MTKPTDLELIKNAAEFCGYEYKLFSNQDEIVTVHIKVEEQFPYRLFDPLFNHNDLVKVVERLLKKYHIHLSQATFEIRGYFVNSSGGVYGETYKTGRYPDDYPRAILELAWEINKSIS